MKQIFLFGLLLIVACNIAFASLNDGLISVWHFDNSSGTDEIGNNDLTLTATAQTTTPAYYPQSTYSPRYDGTCDYYPIYQTSAYDLPKNYTVCMYLNYTSGQQGYLGYWTQVSNWDASTYFMFGDVDYIGATFEGYDQIQYTLDYDEWHYYCFVKRYPNENELGTTKMFVDGVLVNTTYNNTPEPPTGMAYNLISFGDWGNTNKFGIDEASLWFRALSDGEVANSYNNFYPFDNVRIQRHGVSLDTENALQAHCYGMAFKPKVDGNFSSVVAPMTATPMTYAYLYDSSWNSVANSTSCVDYASPDSVDVVPVTVCYFDDIPLTADTEYYIMADRGLDVDWQVQYASSGTNTPISNTYLDWTGRAVWDTVATSCNEAIGGDGHTVYTNEENTWTEIRFKPNSEPVAPPAPECTLSVTGSGFFNICSGTYPLPSKIVIDSDNVYVWCNETILESAVGNDACVDINSKTNVTIDGCTFRNCADAIRVSNTHDVQVLNNKFESVGIAVKGQNNENILIDNNNVTLAYIPSNENSDRVWGFHLFAPSTGITISNNRIDGNYLATNDSFNQLGAFGLHCCWSPSDVFYQVTIANNYVYNFDTLWNDLAGITTLNIHDNIIIGDGSDAYGLVITGQEGANSANISNNQFYNMQVGIITANDYYQVVFENNIFDGGHGGIDIKGYDNDPINNKFINLDWFGVMTEQYAGNYSGNDILFNTFNNTKQAVYLRTDGNIVAYNTFWSDQMTDGGMLAIFLQDSDWNGIGYNTIEDYYVGMKLDGSTNNQVGYNTLSVYNKGIRLGYGTQDSIIANNTIVGKLGDSQGINFDMNPYAPANMYVGYNNISNISIGIACQKTDTATFEGNHIFEFSSDGFGIWGENGIHPKNLILRNNLVDSPITLNQNGIVGINIGRGYGDYLLDGNVIDMGELGYPQHTNDGSRNIFGLMIYSDNRGDLKNITVRNNIIRNVGNHSSNDISAYPDNWAQALNIHGIDSLVFEGNEFTKSVGSLGFGNINNAIIRNNLFEQVLQVAMTRSGSNYQFYDNIVKDGSYAGGFGVSCQSSATCNISYNNISGHAQALGSNTGGQLYVQNNLVTDMRNPYETSVSYNYGKHDMFFASNSGTSILEYNEVYAQSPLYGVNDFIYITGGVTTIQSNTLKAYNCSAPYHKTSGTLTMNDHCLNYNMTAVPELKYIQSGDAFDKGLFSSVNLQWNDVSATYGTRYYKLSIYNGTAWNTYDGLTDLSKVWEIASLPIGTYAVRLQSYTETEESEIQETTLSVEQVYTTQGENITQDTQINYTNVTETPIIQNTGTGTTVDLSSASGSGVVATSEYTAVPVSVATPDISVKITDVYVSSGITGTVKINQSYDEPTLPSTVTESQLLLYAWYDNQWNAGSNQVLDTTQNWVSADFPADKLKGAPMMFGYLGGTYYAVADLPKILIDIFGTAGTNLFQWTPVWILGLVLMFGIGTVLVIRAKMK